MTSRLEQIAARALHGDGASREEALALCREETPLEELLDAADAVRREHCGDGVQLCAIVNAKSGACREDCRFCAQSAKSRTGAAVYPLLSRDLILQRANAAASGAVSAFGIVTSGPQLTDWEMDEIAAAVEEIRRGGGTLPCVSVGELSAAQLARLREAGLWRLHHNLETSERFFPQICSTHTWRQRAETVRRALRAGLRVCSGGLFGLGETWEDRVDLGLALRELGVTSVPVNFLTPVPGTPLAETAPLTPPEALRILAMLRLLLPQAVIRVCGGRPAALRERQREMFRAGASALMTGDYLTTSGIGLASDLALLESLGLRPIAESAAG